MYAIAIYDFGLSKSEFYDLTFAQFSVLSDRLDARIKRDDVQYAYNRMLSVAPHQKKHVRLKIEDFLLFNGKGSKSKKEVTQATESALQVLSLGNKSRLKQIERDKENERLRLLSQMRKQTKK